MVEKVTKKRSYKQGLNAYALAFLPGFMASTPLDNLGSVMTSDLCEILTVRIWQSRPQNRIRLPRQNDPIRVRFGHGLPADLDETCPVWHTTYEGDVRGPVKAHTAETRRRDNDQKDGKPPIIRLLPQKKRLSTI